MITSNVEESQRRTDLMEHAARQRRASLEAATMRLIEQTTEWYYQSMADLERERQTWQGTHDIVKPYEHFDDLLRKQNIGRYLYWYTDAGRSLVEKMVDYVIGRGHTYDLTPKYERLWTGVVEQRALGERAYRETYMALEKVLDQLNWFQVQEETCTRFYSEGEVFRELFMTEEGTVTVRFTETYDVRDPDSDDRIPLAEDEVIEMGVIHRRGDVGDVRGYCVRMREGNETVGWRRAETSDMQHLMVGYANQLRGVPPLQRAQCHTEKIEETDIAMHSLAYTQAAYGALHKFATATDNVEIDRVVEGKTRQWEDENEGKPTPGGVHYLKNEEVELPGASVDAGQFVRLIDQSERFIGNLYSMPAFMITNNAATANRSSLVAAEGPFDRRTQREQLRVSEADTSLLWRGIQMLRSWTDERLESVRSRAVISVTFRSAAFRNVPDERQSLIELNDAQIISRRTVQEQLNYDPSREEMRLREERVHDAAVRRPGRQVPADATVGTGDTGSEPGAAAGAGDRAGGQNPGESSQMPQS